MGSFNTSCFISNLPICGGDRVALFFISNYNRRKEPHSIIYSADLYAPIALPIYGTYNDYGSLENIEIDDNTQLLCDFFKECEKSQTLKFTSLYEESRYEDVLEIEKWVKAIGSREIEFSKYLGNLRYCLAHADMVEEFLKSLTIGEDGNEDSWHPFVELPVLQQHADWWFEWYKDHYEIIDNISGTAGIALRSSEGWNIEAAEENGAYNLKRYGFKYLIKTDKREMNHFISFYHFVREEIYQLPFHQIYSNYTKDLIRNGISIDDYRWISIRDKLVTFIRFCSAMSLHDKTWLPLRLSADYSPEIDKISFLNKKISDKIKRIKKQMDKD